MTGSLDYAARCAASLGMTTMITGLWLPIITPFKDNTVDFKSYERLIEHYLALGVDGLFPLGTTGESPTLDEAEIDELVERTVATVAGRVPVFVGVGGNATAKVEKALKRLERHAFEGIVSVCPCLLYTSDAADE